MVDLINFLKNDTNIQAQGLDKTILVYSEWTVDKLSKNWEQGIILQPLSGTVTTDTDRLKSNCMGRFNFELLVGTQVRNSRSTQQHFEIDDTTTDWALLGAYPDAAFYESVVRQSILDFNAFIKGVKKYDPLVLTELQEPEEINGFLMLKQLYKTSFVF